MARCKRCNSFLILASDTGYCKKCNAEVLREMMNKEAKTKAEEQRRIAQQRKVAEDEERQRRAVKQREIDGMKRVGADSMFAMVILYPDPISTVAAMSGNTDDVLSEKEIAYLGMPAGIVELQAMNGTTVLLHNNLSHAEKSASASVVDAAYVRGKVIKSLGIEPGDKVMLFMKQLDSQSPPQPINSSIYPYLKQMKNMFAFFMNLFKATVHRNENAWQTINRDNMFWANQAIECKREGQYIEACKLYFDNILSIKAITEGWAKGLFKTLAVAGDFADALAFGKAWISFVEPAEREKDQLLILYANLVFMIKSPERKEILKQFLQSLSGNQTYTIDLNRTDYYSEEVNEQLKMFG